MAATDKRIDAYIAKSADFAKPILNHLRALVHKACPDAAETIKWGMPFFETDGSILCNMAAFKQHCSFGLWNAPLLKDPEGLLRVKDKNAMGHFDRITKVKDLPSDKVLIAYLKEAARLNEQGIKKPAPVRKGTKPEPAVPPELSAALKKSKQAKATFEGFSPSGRREYIEWITEAKTGATREKRLATTIAWLEEGKQRMWKYQK